MSSVPWDLALGPEVALLKLLRVSKHACISKSALSDIAWTGRGAQARQSLVKQLRRAALNVTSCSAAEPDRAPGACAGRHAVAAHAQGARAGAALGALVAPAAISQLPEVLSQTTDHSYEYTTLIAEQMQSQC